MIYHFLFGSHLHYGAQLREQINTVNQKQIEMLKSRAVRKITFEKYFDWIDPLYRKLNVSKFGDIVHLQKCLFLWAKLSIMENLQKTSLPLSIVEIITAKIIDQLLKSSRAYLYLIPRPMVHNQPNTTG